MAWMLTWIPSRWVTFEKGNENPDFILNASQMGTSASVGIDIRAKVNYHIKYHNQVVIEKEKQRKRTYGWTEDSSDKTCDAA